jgi:hypothetical protein
LSPFVGKFINPSGRYKNALIALVPGESNRIFAVGIILPNFLVKACANPIFSARNRNRPPFQRD